MVDDASVINGKSSTGLKIKGVEMFTVVRKRMCALVCRTRAVLVARRDAGMVTSEYAVGIIVISSTCYV